jgi:hypothetical protein
LFHGAGFRITSLAADAVDRTQRQRPPPYRADLRSAPMPRRRPATPVCCNGW